MQRDPPQYGDEYPKEFMHKEIGNPYTIDAYDLNMVELALLTNGW